MKKDTALAFGITNNYMDILCNVLIGLKNNNNKFWDDIIIYIDYCTEREEQILNNILKCKIIRINSLPFSIKKSVLETYSIAAFYRYECFLLLSDYHKIIWNDVDILIQGDISGLKSYGDKTGIALTLNTYNLKTEANFNKLIPSYNMYKQLYNSGLFVITDKLDYKRIYEFLYDATKKYGKILRWPDQGIINLLIQKFKLNVELIDSNKFLCHPSFPIYKKAAIIHAYGTEKFWNNPALLKKFPEWTKNKILLKEKYSLVTTKYKKNDDFFVSVLMTTFHDTPYLISAINSILKQTYTNFEFIIVVEYSNQQTKIFNKINKLNDKRIKVILNKKKLGLASSLNIGIENSRGKYIIRMDDDDISLPNRIYEQVRFMESNPNIGISGTMATFFGLHKGKFPLEFGKNNLKFVTLFSCPMVHPSIIINKALLNKNNLRYDPNYFCEDYELYSRAIKFFDIDNLDKTLLMYRSSKSSITGSGTGNDTLHEHHKMVIKNQLKNYLNLELSENEIELIQGRINNLENLINLNESWKIRNNAYKKIVKANKKYKFYDFESVDNYLSSVYISKKGKLFIKNALKFFLKPILDLLKKIYRAVYK